VHIAEDPLRAVARGTSIALKNIDKYPFFNGPLIGVCAFEGVLNFLLVFVRRLAVYAATCCPARWNRGMNRNDFSLLIHFEK